jgi:hypothetical protein
VEPFETTILLRLARRDDLDADAAEQEEPHGELRELGRARRGERRATVGANRRGQAEFGKGGIENRLDVLTVGSMSASQRSRCG